MPRLLQDSSLKSLAQYLMSDVCDNNVFVLCGAGISTSAGIPDFRSPKTGLYANLAKLNLPYPEAVFDIDFFLADPQPFYTLARDIAPGKFVPTPTHVFVRLLHEKGKLHTCFTQNIDTLERKAKVPGHKVIEAHGSFASSRCVHCKTPYDNERMMEYIAQARVPTCLDPDCGSLVKPDIVFFGESLPPQFINAIPALRSAALVIIMGTSLKVQPFSMLPNLVPRTGCPRLLLNLDPAGTIGMNITRSGVPSSGQAGGAHPDSDEEEEEGFVDDVVHLGACDDSVRQLCDLLGWRDELERVWKEVGGGDSVSPVPANPKGQEAAAADDIDIITNTLGSMEMKDRPAEGEENARKPLGAPTGASPIFPHHQPGEDEGVSGVQHVKDNSVEKAMEKIVSDMRVALSNSPKTKQNAQGGGDDFTHVPAYSLEDFGPRDENDQPRAVVAAPAPDAIHIMRGDGHAANEAS